MNKFQIDAENKRRKLLGLPALEFVSEATLQAVHKYPVGAHVTQIVVIVGHPTKIGLQIKAHLDGLMYRVHVRSTWDTMREVHESELSQGGYESGYIPVREWRAQGN